MQKEGAGVMVKKAAVLLLTLGIAGHAGAAKRDSLARFDGGIGVIPVSSAAGTVNADGTSPNVNRNVVRGVNPPGQIWVIARLTAEIESDGRTRVRSPVLLIRSSAGAHAWFAAGIPKLDSDDD